VYRLITRGTIEERILQRAKQKASVQQVVVGNGDVGEFAGRNVDFNEGARQMAFFLMNDEDDVALQKQLEVRQKEKDEEESKKKPGPKKGTKRKKLGASALDGVNSLEDMYHEGLSCSFSLLSQTFLFSTSPLSHTCKEFFLQDIISLHTCSI